MTSLVYDKTVIEKSLKSYITNSWIAHLIYHLENVPNSGVQFVHQNKIVDYDTFVTAIPMLTHVNVSLSTHLPLRVYYSKKLNPDLPWQQCRALNQPNVLQQAVFEFPEMVYAVGDIHGDPDVLLCCLTQLAMVAKVKDPDLSLKYDWNNYIWTARNTMVVFTGDLIDPYRGGTVDSLTDADELFVLRLCNSLSLQALNKNSRLIRLFGNHEAGNLNYYMFGNMRRYMPKNSDYLSRWKRMQPQGDFHRELFACGARSLVTIGPWAFVHGGLSEKILGLQPEENSDSSNISDDTELDYLDKYELQNEPKFIQMVNRQSLNLRHNSKNSRPTPLQSHLFYDEDSMLWTRELSNNADVDCKQLEQIIHRLSPNVKHLVLGHSIQKNINVPTAFSHQLVIYQDKFKTIFSSTTPTRCDDNCGINFRCPLGDGLYRLYLIDVGMSRAFDFNEEKPKSRRPQILAIQKEGSIYQTSTIVSNQF